MDTYTLSCNKEELQALLDLLDGASRSGGLRVTKAVNLWLLKVEKATEPPAEVGEPHDTP